MKTAIVVMGHQADCLSQAKMMLTFAGLLPQGEKELWCLEKEAVPQMDQLPVDVVCHAAVESAEGICPAEWMPVVEQLLQQRQPDAVLFFGNLFGNEMVVRTGVLTQSSYMTDVSALECDGEALLGSRAAYASNLTATFRLEQKPFVLSVAKGTFDEFEGAGAPVVEALKTELLPATWRMSYTLQQEEAEEGLDAADLIVAGGRGMGSKENMDQLRELAELMGAKLGGTRPTVLDAWLKHKYLVGASGTVVHPRLCLTMGSSGAGPFMAGVDRSGILVAVNSDPSAMIFKYCDVGVVDDAIAMMNALKEIIKSEKVGS